VLIHIRLVPCHHGMAGPQVADREGLQIWRVAVNILKKQKILYIIRFEKYPFSCDLKLSLVRDTQLVS